MAGRVGVVSLLVAVVGQAVLLESLYVAVVKVPVGVCSTLLL